MNAGLFKVSVFYSHSDGRVSADLFLCLFKKTCLQKSLTWKNIQTETNHSLPLN